MFKGLQMIFQAYFTIDIYIFGFHMKAKYVPFHMGYGSLVLSKGFQNDRPKCRGMSVEVRRTQ